MHVDCWPARVIVMTLDRVGSQSGPDLERLRTVKAAAKDRAIYAAGGVRGADDLQLLMNAGITGVLVASGLHSGKSRPQTFIPCKIDRAESYMR